MTWIAALVASYRGCSGCHSFTESRQPLATVSQTVSRKDEVVFYERGLATTVFARSEAIAE